MKKHYLLLTAFLFIGFMYTSCKEKADNLRVTYEVTTNKENFDISYIDENGKKIEKTISGKDWTTSLIGKEGDSVSISIKSHNINDKIAAKIIYDNNVIKEIVTYGQLSDEYVAANISSILPY
jgi:hypothetical protein